MASPANVPNVPGVPSVNFAAGFGALATILVSDAIGIFAGAAGIQLWGIYSGFAPLILCDNVVSIDYRNSYSIGDYPIEQGGFQSYDKVNNPFETRVVMSKGGSIAERTAFLASIEAIAGTTDLYNVVTPEKILINCNVNRVNWSRTADQGNGLLIVEVGLEEIRVTASQQNGNTQDASASPQSNGGAVQTQFPTPAQQAAVVNYTPPPAGQINRGDT
jgi:hypothetical protein